MVWYFGIRLYGRPELWAASVLPKPSLFIGNRSVLFSVVAATEVACRPSPVGCDWPLSNCRSGGLAV